MPPLHAFEMRLLAAWPAQRWQDVGVLVAVSGGADSVALVRAMQALKSGGPGRLAVAHFNHRLRADASDADAEFVAALCGSLGLECLRGHAQTLLAGAADGLEAAAREARYDFLRRAAEQAGARYVATAHTADDQAETILHHVLRGTGLWGLAGMRPARPLGPAVTLVRPLLDLGRDDVLGYLAALGQEFRDDTTNTDLRFTRNRIRHELLPLVKRDIAPSVVASLVRLGRLASDAGRVVDAAAEKLLERSLIESDANRVALDCRKLAGEDRHLVRELFVAVWRRQQWPLQAMGYAEWDLLADMALAATALRVAATNKNVLPGAIVAHRLGEQLLLMTPSTPGTGR
jgi:tRNA(Ile)-lysidine synthase